MIKTDVGGGRHQMCSLRVSFCTFVYVTFYILPILEPHFGPSATYFSHPCCKVTITLKQTTGHTLSSPSRLNIQTYEFKQGNGWICSLDSKKTSICF